MGKDAKPPRWSRNVLEKVLHAHDREYALSDLEEEFVVLTEGSGTWYLNGKEITARKGAVAYDAPWDLHSFRASKDGPAAFLVVKFGYKGLKNPEKPAGK